MPDESARAQALAAWSDEAAHLDWARPWTQLCDERPGAGSHWFVDARIDVAHNCLHRHLADRSERVALWWEGEPGDTRSLTYGQLADEVERFAAGLADLGVGRGDRVALYLGLLPETVVAMLACARLGAVHAMLFSTLPADALADRLEALAPRVLITQDGSWRNGVVLPLKSRADEALAATSGVDHTVVVRRTGIDVDWYEGDRPYKDVLADGAGRQLPATEGSADDPLLVVHLADRRRHPIEVVHRTGGYLVYADTLHRRALSGGPDEVFWAAVDIGWLAGQAHGVYGPLAAGATTLLYEGTLDTPTHARAWQLIERYGVNALVTTPSVARNLRQWADAPPSQAELGSLRSIVHLGEPIDTETRRWLEDEVGGGRCVVRDGWGQTELGGICTVDPPPQPPLPDPGLEVVDDHGRPAASGQPGELVITHPWPAMFLDIRHPDATSSDRYWRYPGAYATGDLARREPDGRIEILGRMDPVVLVSGQLVSADEVREALEEHPLVAAAEAVGCPDPRSGHVMAAYVALEPPTDQTAPSLAAIARELRGHVDDTLGGLARPRSVGFLQRMPDDTPRELLRSALADLCRAPHDLVFEVSDAQLETAISARRGTSR
ncbi:MAG: AMP-binding protein [Actinomycetota bacterium]